MKLTQLLEALDKRGINEVLLRGGEPMQNRVEGEWQAQGSPIPVGALSAMLEAEAPDGARAQWQNENRCQFEQNGFLLKAARKDERVQIAIKRAAASSSPFAGTGAAPVASPVVAPATQTVFAPAAKAPLKPAVVEWFYLDGSAEKGPIAPDRVRVLASTGTISGDTMVWSDGMSDWKPARDSDLRAMLPAGALNPVPVAPPLSPPIAAPRGDSRPGRVGGGRIHEIPPSHDSFSLGAFVLPLFWCIAHNQTARYWPIFWVRFIPCVGGWISLWQGGQLAGEANSLGWISREWDSVEHFEKTQKVWTVISAIILVIYVGLIVAGAVLDDGS